MSESPSTSKDTTKPGKSEDAPESEKIDRYATKVLRAFNGAFELKDLSSRERKVFSVPYPSACYDLEIDSCVSKEFWLQCEDEFKKEIKEAFGEHFNPYNITAHMKGMHGKFSEDVITRVMEIFKKLIKLKVFIDHHPFKTVREDSPSLPRFLDVTDEQVENILQKLSDDISSIPTGIPLKTIREVDEKFTTLLDYAQDITDIGIFIGGKIMKAAYGIVTGQLKIKRCIKLTDKILRAVRDLRVECADLMNESGEILALLPNVTYLRKINAQLGISCYAMSDEIVSLNMYLHDNCAFQIEKEEEVMECMQLVLLKL